MDYTSSKLTKREKSMEEKHDDIDRKEECAHKSDEIQYLTVTVEFKCIKCGEFFYSFVMNKTWKTLA